MTPELLLAISAALALVLVLRRPEWWQGLARGLRAAPVEMVAGLILIAVAVAALLDGVVTFSVALAVGLIVLVLAGIDVVRDYVLGVVLRASGRLRIGDVVVIEDHEGVVAEIGRLSVLLDDARGRLLVPHSKVVRGIVHRRSQRVGPLPHRFEVDWSDETTHADVTRRIVRTVLLHPRAAGRDPEVEPLGPRKVAVTVYTVASAHGFEVERSVRDALGDRGGPKRHLTLPPPPSDS